MTRLHIKKNQLIAVAGVVWLLAGLNVAVLGVRAAIGMRGLAAIVLVALAGGAVAIFCAFHPMFSKLVKKNAQRIADLEGERHHVVRFFDRKSYLMMAIMMSFGIGMRAAGLFPDWFIAFFYTGLGLALTLGRPLAVAIKPPQHADQAIDLGVHLVHVEAAELDGKLDLLSLAGGHDLIRLARLPPDRALHIGEERAHLAHVVALAQERARKIGRPHARSSPPGLRPSATAVAS